MKNFYANIKAYYEKPISNKVEDIPLDRFLYTKGLDRMLKSRHTYIKNAAQEALLAYYVYTNWLIPALASAKDDPQSTEHNFLKEYRTEIVIPILENLHAMQEKFDKGGFSRSGKFHLTLSETENEFFIDEELKERIDRGEEAPLTVAFLPEKCDPLHFGHQWMKETVLSLAGLHVDKLITMQDYGDHRKPGLACLPLREESNRQFMANRSPLIEEMLYQKEIVDQIENKRDGETMMPFFMNKNLAAAKDLMKYVKNWVYMAGTDHFNVYTITKGELVKNPETGRPMLDVPTKHLRNLLKWVEEGKEPYNLTIFFSERKGEELWRRYINNLQAFLKRKDSRFPESEFADINNELNTAARILDPDLMKKYFEDFEEFKEDDLTEKMRAALSDRYKARLTEELDLSKCEIPEIVEMRDRILDKIKKGELKYLTADKLLDIKIKFVTEKEVYDLSIEFITIFQIPDTSSTRIRNYGEFFLTPINAFYAAKVLKLYAYATTATRTERQKFAKIFKPIIDKIRSSTAEKRKKLLAEFRNELIKEKFFSGALISIIDKHITEVLTDKKLAKENPDLDSEYKKIILPEIKKEMGAIVGSKLGIDRVLSSSAEKRKKLLAEFRNELIKEKNFYGALINIIDNYITGVLTDKKMAGEIGDLNPDYQNIILHEIKAEIGALIRSKLGDMSIDGLFAYFRKNQDNLLPERQDPWDIVAAKDSK